MTEPDPQPPERAPGTPAVDDDGEEILCRYCFDGPEEGTMLSGICACAGGQKHVHLDCLRRWQRMVLVSQPTHPAFYEDDVRHHKCNVCAANFNIPPPTRNELMQTFTGAEIAALVDEGCVIGSQRAFSDELERQLVSMPFFQRLVCGYRNWIKGVYLITGVTPDDGTVTLPIRSGDTLDQIRDRLLVGDATTDDDEGGGGGGGGGGGDGATERDLGLMVSGRRHVLVSVGGVTGDKESLRRALCAARAPVELKLSTGKEPDCGEDHVTAVNLARLVPLFPEEEEEEEEEDDDEEGNDAGVNLEEEEMEGAARGSDGSDDDMDAEEEEEGSEEEEEGSEDGDISENGPEDARAREEESAMEATTSDPSPPVVVAEGASGAGDGDGGDAAEEEEEEAQAPDPPPPPRPPPIAFERRRRRRARDRVADLEDDRRARKGWRATARLAVSKAMDAVAAKYPGARAVEITHFAGGPCDEREIVTCVVPGGVRRGWTVVTKRDGGLEAAIRLAHGRAARRAGDAQGRVSGSQTVRLKGLSARPELNGEIGLALRFEASTGRWLMRLRNGDGKQVKPENLEPMEGAGGRVFAFWGDARWSRAQLLGEIARGHWGLCRGSVADIACAPEAQYESLLGSERLAFAPVTEMTEDFLRNARREMAALGSIARETMPEGEEAEEEGDGDSP